MSDIEKELVVGRCKIILAAGKIHVFRFAGVYTVKDKYSLEKIFEIKPADPCDLENETNKGFDCLVVNGKKYIISEQETNLLAMVKEIHDNQDKNVTEEKNKTQDQPSVLKFLDKFIHR